MSIVKSEDFFKFGIQDPINRLAYTPEDANYKLMCMKRMQDLGMRIQIDKLGNIIGTLPSTKRTGKKIVMESHTDSVFDGGQYDGVVGVYSALSAAEQIKQSGEDVYADIVVAICACEESSRFGKACLGSRYIGEKNTMQQPQETFERLPKGKKEAKTVLEQLSSLKDKNGITAEEAISEYLRYINGNLSNFGVDATKVSFVDRALSEDEITEAYEVHIEQAKVLTKSGIDIGVVSSIAEPVRGKLVIDGEDAIIVAAKSVMELTAITKESVSKGEEDLRITIPQFDCLETPDSTEPNKKAKDKRRTIVSTDDNKLLEITVNGENAHSGATPMDERKDAVVAISDLILRLSEFSSCINFLDTRTPQWGTNQVQNKVNMILNIKSPDMKDVILEKIVEIEKQYNVQIAMKEIEKAEVPEKPKMELTVDARQQHDRTGNGTRDRLYQAFVDMQHNRGVSKSRGAKTKANIGFHITGKNTPVKTSSVLVGEVADICAKNGISYKRMPSWAGHDLAFVFSKSNTLGKRVLIFIPHNEPKGISHNPEESTSKEHIERGAKVLYQLCQSRLEKMRKSLSRDDKESDARE